MTKVDPEATSKKKVIIQKQEVKTKDVLKIINKAHQFIDSDHMEKMIKQVGNILTNDQDMIMTTINPDIDNAEKVIDTNEIMTMMIKMNNRRRKG